MTSAVARRGIPIPLWLASALAVAALLALLVIGLSKAVEEDGPLLSQQLNPLNSQALLQTLLERVEASNAAAQPVGAIKRRLAENVGDARFYSLLGVAEQRSGRPEVAEALFAATLRLSKSEQNAGLHVVALELGRGRYEEAFRQADILLSRWPGHAGRVGPALGKVAVSSPEALAIMTRALSRNPTWRAGLLLYMSGRPDTLAILPALLIGLTETARPPTASEVNYAVNALLATGQARTAYQVFTLTRTGDQRRLAGPVYDARFQGVPSGNAFDWTASASAAAEIVLPAGPDGGATIEFQNRPAVGTRLSQMLALFPGSYVATFTVEAQRLATPEPIVAAVDCGGGRKLSSRPVPPGAYGPTALTVPFDVPLAGCDTQRVSLESSQSAPRWSKSFSGVLRVHSAVVEPAP